MRASVVLPIYNESKFMHVALDSLKNQTMPFELIVVDDGSTDDSVQIARLYTSNVFKQPRQGKLSALQLGILDASGEVVFTVDADCVYQNDYVEKIMVYFQDPNVVLVCATMRGIGDTSTMNFIRSTKETLGFGLLKYGAGATSAMRRDAFITAGGFNLNVNQFDFVSVVFEEEIGLHQRLASLGRAIYDPSIVVYHIDRRGVCAQCPHLEEALCLYCQAIQRGERF